MARIIETRPLNADDRKWAAAVILERWGAETVVVHQTIYRPALLDGVVAERAGRREGLLTYHIDDLGCEIVTLDALSQACGAGTALVEAVARLAVLQGCRRLWLITTNDNLEALRFYQRRGFRLVRVHPGAVDSARDLKPTIPLVGEYGIPIHDELELVMTLPGT